jgi:hypothetical protein
MIQVLFSGSRLPLCARASNVGSQENGAPACAEVANASADAPVAISKASVEVRFTG